MGILSTDPFSEEERWEISRFLKDQNKETAFLWKYLISSIPTKDLRWIINDVKKYWFKEYSNIARRHNIAPKSKDGQKIKKLTKIILTSFKKEETIEETKDSVKEVLNKKRTRRQQEQILTAKKIKKYLEINTKEIFGIFKWYYLTNKEYTDNFYDNTEFATKKICKIYRREYNDEILELFRDWARWNDYLESSDQEIQEDI